jgi:superfamily II DNA or RNA helicase
VLLTNCDELPAVLNDRQGFFCIRGSDLDRLEAGDFRAMEAWLADAAYTAPKKSPQPHQTEALDALLPALQTHDRVSAIMACGTGKTLVALWVAESVARASSPAGSSGVPPPVGEHAPGRCLNPPPGTVAPRILILLPSLALLRQTLHEWLRETRLPSLAYLCVCSDPTVKEGIDALTTQQSDLDFQVSTDAASVRSFLDAPFAGVKMIFSTYQSASVVGAAMQPGEAFDFAVFDEAHKTAGREGRNFAFALDDKNLPIRKRLFLTATPRHYNPHDRDREGEARLLFSMDNPAVYGPQAYRLTFAEAARRGIICGYKVIISVITSEMVTNELLSHGEVLVNGDAVRARQVANQIALRDAIEKYDVKKVFTFHRDVKSAQSFVSAGPEGVGTHLNDVAADVRRLHSNSEISSSKSEISQSLVTSAPTNKFQIFHVNGSMPTARRERELRDFRAAARAVVSNARCLTEGVDVPAVDMVAFLSPRRSRVDIVQATGRAMRRSPGKTTGYVLVPLYVELTTGETVEAAVNRAQFDEVWDVLQSLQEQDDVLAEIIRAMREDRGRTNSFDDSRFHEIVEVCGPSIPLDKLRIAITTTCVNVLGVSWDERFGELLAYKDEFKDCDVPVRYSKNRQLGTWVVAQRQSRKFGELSETQIRRLEEIGFNWRPHGDNWDDKFAKLVAFKATNNHCDVPQRYKDDPELGIWVNRQRVFKKAGILRRKDQIAKLDGIGFSWHGGGASWEESFRQLVAYKRKHGHFSVSKNDDPKLAYWVKYQGYLKRNDKLSVKKVRQLESIGFGWGRTLGERGANGLTVEEQQWERMFNELLEFKKSKGHSNVPSKKSKLGNWVMVQRRNKKRKNDYNPERVRRLNEIGFNWVSQRSKLTWDELYAVLLKYKREHGDCNVPVSWPENQKLRWWVQNQRSAKKAKKLSDDKIRRLDEIGF